MTSKEVYSYDPMCCAYRLDIKKQLAPLLKFINCLESIKFINKKGHSGEKIFQRGMIITIKATIKLQEILETKYNLPHLIVNSTNQC